MSITLQEIDERFAADPGFRHVARLEIDESGVDPIGMRQINLDLMDATVPGINNVVDHVRPYSFMAWAWWRAGRTLERDGMVDPVRMRDTVQRYEAMYAWSHLLAGRLTKGADAIRRHLPQQGSSASFRFEGEMWDRLKKDMLSFMAPTEYGPSIKALKWLIAADGGAFRVSEEVVSAVKAVDAIVSAHLAPALLAPEPPLVICEQVLGFAEHLPADSAEVPERDAFRHLFYDAATRADAPRDVRRRAATIDLLRAHLVGAGRPVTIPEIRRTLTKGRVPELLEGDPAEITVTATLHCILQVRQLQRLATEAAMLWIERNLGTETSKARSSEELAAQADQEAREQDKLAAKAATVGTFMDAIEALGSAVGWPAAAAAPETDVAGLVEALHHAQNYDLPKLPGLCLRSFAVVRAVTRGVRAAGLPKVAANFIEKRADRLPFTVLERDIGALYDKPLVRFWRQVVEHWVIGQHVHWSAIRGGDGKKRLRIGLEGDGWIRVRPHPSGRFDPTPDRLLRLLLLGSECGLFSKVVEDSVIRFTV